jgi:BRCT domain type II-containing protein
MNGLHPIIRRKRRPLYVEDVPPMAAKAKPVQSVAEKPVVEPAKHKKTADADKTSSPAAP